METDHVVADLEDPIRMSGPATSPNLFQAGIGRGLCEQTGIVDENCVVGK